MIKNEFKCETRERIENDDYVIATIEGQDYEVCLSRIKAKKKVLICDLTKDVIDGFEVLEYNDKKYYIFNKNCKLYITRHLNTILRRKASLASWLSKKNAYIFGLFSDIESRFCGSDYVYLNEEIIGSITRPFRFWKFKHLCIIKIPIEKVISTNEIHNNVSVGDKNGNVIPVKLKKRCHGMKYFQSRRVGDEYVLMRTAFRSASLIITHIKMTPEYLFRNKIKTILAFVVSKVYFWNKSCLMFEKESSRACESGYYVFRKILRNKNIKTKVYYVLDAGCDDFERIKSKYGKRVLAKYSFRHYLHIFKSKYFISSELSNHAINPRLYNKLLNNTISRKPLVFLQHGIMFAKPVDNPAAAGFRKNSKSVNFYKSVISSELEATQFYKCGFVRSDLIKCGLPKFDISRLKSNADKIAIMLTYRYWEEPLVMEGRIKETTYYQTYMSILEALEKNGLLEKVIISCHPKFKECMSEIGSKYAQYIEDDATKALEQAKIFITDYSSASYDAHYRGAYIIYYWAERDYLIENYQAIPPINEDNCDGVPVFSVDELIHEIRTAISKHFRMASKYERRYAKINEYHDNKNAKRLIEELIQLGVLKERKHD